MFLGHHGTCNVFHFFFQWPWCARRTWLRSYSLKRNRQQKQKHFWQLWNHQPLVSEKKPYCAVCGKRPKKNTEVFSFIFARPPFLLCLETTRTIAAACLTLISTCNERPAERKTLYNIRWKVPLFSVSEALHFISRDFISVWAEADSRRTWHNSAGPSGSGLRRWHRAGLRSPGWVTGQVCNRGKALQSDRKVRHPMKHGQNEARQRTDTFSKRLESRFPQPICQWWPIQLRP